jgi:hypothetical protein
MTTGQQTRVETGRAAKRSEDAHFGLQAARVYGLAQVRTRSSAKGSIAIVDTHSGGAEYGGTVRIELANFCHMSTCTLRHDSSGAHLVNDTRGYAIFADSTGHG